MSGVPPVIPPPVPAAARLAPLRVAPGFWAALRGIWLLTWHNQCTWRGLGGSLLALLALPLLCYLIGMPLPQRPDLVGNPERDLIRFSSSLSRHGMPLTSAQSNQLAAIFNEEYAGVQNMPKPPFNLTPEEAAKIHLHQVQDWNGRLLERAEGVLDTNQFQRFQSAQKSALNFRSQEATRVRWNSAAAFYYVLVDFYFFLVLPLVCVRSCGALIRDELQADTLGFLTTRPVPRATITIVKYISQSSWLLGLLFLQTALLYVAGAARHIPDLPAIFGLLLLAQCLAVPAWSALGLLLGLFTKRYIAAALVYGFVVELGIGRIPSNVSSISLMRLLKTLLANNATLRERFEWTDQAVAWPILALLIATSIFLGASAALFTFREYNQEADMQK